MSETVAANVCVVCGWALTEPLSPEPGGGYRVRCPGCLEYCLTPAFTRTPPEIGDKRRPLSAACRQAADRGKPLILDLANWALIAEQHLKVPVSRKLELLDRKSVV